MAPVRLLLIDDSPNDRLLAVRQLKQEFSELQPLEVCDAEGLTQALNENRFDIVITDYQLRWTTGLDVLEEIKQRRPDCPVVMFTGTGSEEIAVTAMKAGLDDYVVKSPQHYVRLAKATQIAWERTQQQQALKEAEERYQRLFEEVPIGLYRLTREGKLLDANRRFLEILGYESKDEVLATDVVNDCIATAASGLWTAQLDVTDATQSVSTHLRHRSGDEIWVRHYVRLVRNPQGNTQYYEGAIEDITAYRRTELERNQLLISERKARAEAETANRVKDEFLATVSHELRTPLNAMLGWVQLLRGGQLSEEKSAKAIEIIERNAIAQNQLIDDLLDVSRIIRGKLKLKVKAIPLRNIVNAALDTVRHAVENKQIQLETDFAPSVTLVNGDQERLQQVFWNLLTNAVKFTPEGGKITIRVESKPNCAQVQIVDTGQGIEPGHLPYMFERFRQADESSTRQKGGLGLGLAIVRHLVELHGGVVTAESAGTGQGSTFMVQLPLFDTVQPLAQISLPADQSLPSLKNLQLLVVEDEDDAREMLTLLLEQCGAQISAVGSVSAAMAHLAHHTPHLIISDIAMPVEDGYTLIRQLRAEGRQIVAIALTAYAREQDKTAALQAGFNHHLPKPVDPNQLVQLIANLRQAGEI
ncbi:Autoinducer 2 sensor kinase/phosphatase LuxQ [Acaryochloris thomasi RCC1774]|uniref:histidine kinase n=1 Tax=Acaryochloris thomasi RCC1774 TaxID=1764569 RepID=A0A2W1JNU5_9CYAN|nr:response regulator [Acaryochloris thomasi]PZD75018.1 Autoinducer 2 sensor kinase/phosphatase LuxQ [Acaryochloris thomasi RCC1774]